MYFDFNLIPLMVLGCVLVLFAKPLASKTNVKVLIGNENWKKISTWIIRLTGIVWVVFSLNIATSPSTWYSDMMVKDSTCFRLLEKGNLTKAKVTRFYFEEGAPCGWAIKYEFTAKNPKTGKEQIWSWTSQGPIKYFLGADEVTIIYDPCDPRLNEEVRCFLNHPSMRYTLRKKGKINLLDRFRDKVELEDYSFEDWYDQQQTK